MNRVIIAGGGASGLMAAIAAAQSGADVLVLEGAKTIGRKILASGNGRCNLTNSNMSEEYYSDKALARSVLSVFGYKETLRFFNESGLLTYADSEGRVYPYSNSSACVLSFFTRKLNELGVKIKTEIRVLNISVGKKLSVLTDRGDYDCGAIVYALGSGAGLKKPFDNSDVTTGYATLRRLRPALVPLVTDPELIRGLDGVRARAAFTLVSDGKEIYTETGEVQFKADALSGIAVFNASVHYVRQEAAKRHEILLDLMPDYSDKEIDELSKNLTLEAFLYGAFTDKLAKNLLNRIKTAKEVKRLRFPIIITYGMPDAQIAAGGVDRRSFDEKTLESNKAKGLFFCGEAVDIDAPCGGYNLQWAFSSGMVAGKNAAEHVKNLLN